MITEIFIGTQKIDLFKDETIDLNSSVANTDDITKVNTDYTKSFTVPASDRNNFIFKHYYNADIDNTFDARVKVQGEIKIDGFPFKSGKFRLEKVAVKNGLAQSYTINFWGNLINIKELLGEKELSFLNFEELNHEYTNANVKVGLENGLEDGDIIYTIDNSKRQYLYSTESSNNINSENLVNIANNNATDKGIRYTDLRASIRLSKVVQKISDTFGFNFSNDFFAREEIKDIYLWLNNNLERAFTTTGLIDFTTTDSPLFDLAENTLNFETFVNSSTDKQRLICEFDLTQLVAFEDLTTFEFIVRDNGKILSSKEVFGNHLETIVVESIPLVSHSLTFEIRAVQFPDYTVNLTFFYQTFDGNDWINGTIGTAEAFGASLTPNFDVSANMPKIKIIDFISGLFKMFKLVAIGNDDGSIYINSIDSFYKSGTLRDFTKYIDVKNYDVERGNLAKEISFKYQEPTTLLNKRYKQNNNIAYGDNLLQLVDENNVPLDGDKIDIQLPFEVVLYERLTDIFTNQQTNIQYGLSVSDTLEPILPKPVLFYNNVVQLSSTSIRMEGGLILNTTLNTASSTLGLNTANNSLLWNNEFSTWNGALINNTLYSSYWQNYIESIFNIKKRIFKYKAKLPIYLLTQLKLNDIIKIKDSYYKINDYNVSLLTGDASFNLINNFDTNFNLFAPSKKEFYQDYTAQSFKIYVSNSSVMNITLQDLGFGTSFITAVKNGNYIDITLTQNALTQNRDVFVNVNNGAGKSFQIYINQDNEI